MSKEFKTLMECLDNLHNQYFEALCAFRTYEALRNLRAPNIIGKENAEKNAKVMSRFTYFFGPAERAIFQSSLLDLAKIFDESNQALHINYILDYVTSNREKLSKTDFRDFNQGRQFLDNLHEKYSGMSVGDLLAVKNNLAKHKLTLGKLKAYRDQYLAHSDKKKDPIILTFDEVRSLFLLAEETLNLFTQKLNDSATMYSHIEEYTMRDTKYLLIALERSEVCRQKEFQDRVTQRQKDKN